jgi:hypothetical protein
MQKHLLVLLIAIATLVASVPCRAQIIAPPLAQKSLDVGVAYKWFDRDVTSGQLDEAKWEVATIYTRYGAWEWLTIGAEAGLWEIGARDEEFREFNRWAVGVFASARFYQRERWSIFASGTYNDMYDLDQSELRSDERTRSWTAGVLAAFSFHGEKHRVNVFAGPLFVDDTIEAYPFNAEDPVTLDTDATLGVTAGVNGHVFRHLSGFASIVYADHPQARLGIGVRLGAGEQ